MRARGWSVRCRRPHAGIVARRGPAQARRRVEGRGATVVERGRDDVSVVGSIASRRALRWSAAAVAASVLLAFGLQTNGSAAATTATAGPGWATLFAKYVGAKVVGPANSKLAPVTVGWVNAQGGIVQSPESTIAVNFAVSVINKYLGGVGGGHPLKLKECFVVQSEAQGQACAQAFDNNPAVKFVLEGVMPFGSTGFMQTNNGKLPVL